MRLQLALGAAALAVTAAGAAHAGTVVEIKEAAARVTVIPENRRDVQVRMVTTNRALPLEVRNEGDRVVVDGNLRRRIRGCRGARWGLDFGGGHESHGASGVNVQVRGVGRVDWANLPQIVVHTPMDARVRTSGAVFGSIGRANTVSLDNAGCGDWTIANVRGKLDIDMAGSGDTRAGTAGALKSSIAGSGDISAQAVNGPVSVDIAGSGDVAVASMNGLLDVDIAGSGDVHVMGGRAGRMDVNIAGSGDVELRGPAQSLDVSVMGSGDVQVASVSGQISRHVMGSGSVYVGGQEIKSRRERDRDED